MPSNMYQINPTEYGREIVHVPQEQAPPDPVQFMWQVETRHVLYIYLAGVPAGAGEIVELLQDLLEADQIVYDTEVRDALLTLGWADRSATRRGALTYSTLTAEALGFVAEAYNRMTESRQSS